MKKFIQKIKRSKVLMVLTVLGLLVLAILAACFVNPILILATKDPNNSYQTFTYFYKMKWHFKTYHVVTKQVTAVGESSLSQWASLWSKSKFKLMHSETFMN